MAFKEEDKFDEEAYAASKVLESTTCYRCQKMFEEGKEPIILIYPEGAALAGEFPVCSEYCLIDCLQRKLKRWGEYHD
jgi:hypothetical protein